MQVVVIADGITQIEFQDKPIPAGIKVQFVATIAEINRNADAYFYLLEENDLTKDLEQLKNLHAPVFVNAVSTTLKDLSENCIRICGWRGFLLQETIEICASQNFREPARRILNGLRWLYLQVPDIVGLVAPRATALLINEAYLIIADNQSQKQEIDAAIKLGTNFRSGPFEMAETIGLQKIYNLLVHLTVADLRYSPAPFLKKEISQLGAAS